MPPAPQSLADLLAEDSGDDVDKMQVDPPSAVAPPEKAAAPPAVPPLDIPQLLKPDRLENLSSIGSIDNAKPGTPKRKSRTAEAFMDTMRGKEFVQKFRNAGKDTRRGGGRASGACASRRTCTSGGWRARTSRGGRISGWPNRHST